MGRGAASVFLLILVIPLTAGCLGSNAAPVRVVSYLPINDAQPGRGTEFLFLIESLSQFKQSLEATMDGLPRNWTATLEESAFDLRGRSTRTLIVRVTPPADAAYGPQVVSLSVGGARGDVIVNVKDLGREPLRAGIGTTLYYVGAYTNGTLFDYNEPSIEGRGIPYAPPGEPDENATVDHTPLKVYVGGQRGQPPPEPYNGTGYRPVIPGFDARLRDAGNGAGMVAGETLALRIPKEKAYTVAGNEDHVLYGEDLTFLIRIVSVDILVARDCGLPVCPP